MVGWARKRKGARGEELLALEALLGRPLPVDYGAFLREHNGGEPAPNTFQIPGGDNESGVNEFMSVRQIQDELSAYGRRLPPATIPIAYAEGGNLVLLTLDEGRVSFWDHELEASNPTVTLTSDFSAFWEALEPFDPSAVQLKPGQVKSAWIDPDLLK